MTSIFDIINIPLGYLFGFIYQFVQNYGLTLILFTLITKAVLLPLTIKQQKSMAKMQAIQPMLAELQKKYEFDKEKQQSELMKIYKENGVNPAGGCLPLVIQFPFLIALYKIIRQPLTYVYHLGKNGLPKIDEVIAVLSDKVPGLTVANEIPIADAMHKFPELIQTAFPNINISPIDFNFLGMNLSETPSITHITLLTLIPVLAGVTTYLVSWASQRMAGTPQTANSEDATQSTMKMMNYMFPFMTAFFAISMPAGLGFYWILSNIVQLIQQYAITNFFNPAGDVVLPEKAHYRERNNRRKK